jgi:hypothetical protein
MIGFLKRKLFGKKMWVVNGHVVERKTVTKRFRKAGHSDAKRKVGGFECIGCEKFFQHREDFKDEECYEVIVVDR